MPVRFDLLIAGACLAAGAAAQATAGSPEQLRDAYGLEAKAEDPAFAGFSAERGSRFFAARHGREWSCASCHTGNAAGQGKHATTGKAIAPLAPAANPERFASAPKTEKWFRRNCNDVLGRACTAREKGDVLAWLMTLR
jgi:cytochrome c peroxidase